METSLGAPRIESSRNCESDLPVWVFADGRYAGGEATTFCRQEGVQRSVVAKALDFETPQLCKLVGLVFTIPSSFSTLVRIGLFAVREKNLAQTWKDVVRDALKELGGQGHLRQINEIARTNPKTRTNPTWKDTIRRVVRQYAIFEPVPPQRSGVYRLVERPSVVPNSESMTGSEGVDHGIAQGMLLALGQLYGFETFAPATDRTSRKFQDRQLSDFTTVTDCSGFCGKRSLPRVRQIDAIWLAEDNDGVYPVYAFEVEHTTKVRSGMDRLIEIPERYSVGLFVIAPGEDERRLFQSLIGQARFRRFRERVQFREYAQLETLYNAAITHDERRSEFGIKEHKS